MFLKFFLKSSPDAVTEEEVAYFRDHPDEIDEWTKPVNVHKMARGGPTRDRQDPGS